MKATKTLKPGKSHIFEYNGLPAIIFILWIILFAFGKAPVFGDPDTGWHLAAGDLIRQTHHLPAKDGWSFTAGETQWYNISWLFDVAVSWINGWGGFPLLYSLTVLLFASLGAYMVHRAIRSGAGMLPVVLIASLAAIQVFGGVLLRPNLVSTLMMVVFYKVLSDEIENIRHHPSWQLPALTVIWVNCHGGVLAGLVLIGIFFISACAEHRYAAAKRFFIIGILCAMATLVNPYGYDVYLAMWKTLHSDFGKKFVMEWRAFNAGDPAHSMVLVFIGLCIWLAPFGRKSIPLHERIMVLGWLVLALFSMRHSIILGILAIPTLSLSLTEWLQSRADLKRIKQLDESFRLDMTNPKAHTGIYTCAFVWLVILLAPFPLPQILPQMRDFDSKVLPREEARYIAQHYPHARFLNDYNLGGYLIYAGRGVPELFIDGRADTAYPPQLLEDYFTFVKHAGLDNDGKKVLETYHIDGLILSNQKEDLAIFTSNPYWKTAFKGPAATVLVHSTLH